MKKLISFLICTFLCFNITSAAPIVYEKPDVKIIVEGEELKLDTEVPIIVNSRTLVPLRKLLVGLGVPDNNENIQWIGEKREVKVIYNGVTIDLAIDSSKGYINGKEYALDSAPIIHNSRTYLPARFVGEALGYTISWDQYTPAVLVQSNKKMEILKQILNDLKSAISDVNSYEVASSRDVKTEEKEYTITSLEKADLGKKVIYNESGYKDLEENKFYLSYSTEDSFYSCYKYLEGYTLYNTGWKKEEADKNSLEETPFDKKEKLGIINIDESLYGALSIEEYNNAYVVSSVSNQLDLLKVLDGHRLYDEVAKNVTDFDFSLAISKETKLPIELEINFTLKDGEKIEENQYIVSFLEYDHYLDLEIPAV